MINLDPMWRGDGEPLRPVRRYEPIGRPGGRPLVFEMPPYPKIPSTAGPDSSRADAGIKEVAAGLVAAAVVVGFLYVGRDVLVPLALTALISFALGPLVSWLRPFVGLKLAVALAVLLAVVVVGGATFLLAWQIADLAANLPKYRTNLIQKIEDLRAGGGLIADGIGAVRELAEDLTRPKVTTGTRPEGQPPIPVKIQESTALEVTAAYLLPVIVPLLVTGLVIVLVVFMLLEREPLRDRLIRLISRGDISLTTSAINDAVERLSRFLATQLLINIAFGAVIAGGLWLIGMPSPLVWGLLAAVLRFVPYAGSLITAVLPTLVAIAVAPGWTLPIMTFALIVACEIIVGQVVEPLRYGSTTGMSPLAVLVSTVAWVALWGPVGLLLAMPITVCLIVIGRHVPQLEFFGVLLGDEPALPAEVQIYHRLLAYSPVDAAEIAVDRAQEKGVLALYHDVLMPMLMLAETDRRRGALDEPRLLLVAKGVDEIVAAVAEEPDSIPEKNEEGGDGEAGKPEPSESAASGKDVVSVATQAVDTGVTCVGGRSQIDRAAAALAADILRRRGIPANACAMAELADVSRTADSQRDANVVALCIVMPGSATIIHHLLRRIYQHSGADVPVVVGSFGAEIAPTSSLASIPIARTLSDLGEVAANTIAHRAGKA
ncbi:MAG TPA: AI-2E family transporter [Vineibacter sp.]|nr:AI-2E family transporter [Vineibacter sp.]